MLSFINSAWSIGSLKLTNRLIQGPLAGFSCAPFRQLFYQFTPPAYCVSEMLSAYDVLYKHQFNNRYLYRDSSETKLAYQLAGNDAGIMAEAASHLQALGADIIDINCGCPKTKIRKKGAGSALLQQPHQLLTIVQAVRKVLHCPLTIKIRLQGNHQDLDLAQSIADAGADALIIHGRRWQDNYDVPCDLAQIARIKQVSRIPVITNGDIRDHSSLKQAIKESEGDGFMISRAGTGKPWLYQQLLEGLSMTINHQQRLSLFMTHLHNLARLEGEHQAVLQSRSLVSYYFPHLSQPSFLSTFYQLASLIKIAALLKELSNDD